VGDSFKSTLPLLIRLYILCSSIFNVFKCPKMNVRTRNRTSVSSPELVKKTDKHMIFRSTVQSTNITCGLTEHDNFLLLLTIYNS